MRFETNSLLSKWGFNDGEQCTDWLWDNGFSLWAIDQHPAWDLEYTVPTNGEQRFGFGDAVLIEVIRQHVVPSIDQQVEVRGFTNHNPVRAVTIDGRDVPYDVYFEWKVDGYILTPETVEVPDEVVSAIAHSLAATGARPRPPS